MGILPFPAAYLFYKYSSCNLSYVKNSRHSVNINVVILSAVARTDHLISGGGGGSCDVFEKIVCFLSGAKKIKCQ